MYRLCGYLTYKWRLLEDDVDWFPPASRFLFYFYLKSMSPSPSISMYLIKWSTWSVDKGIPSSWKCKVNTIISYAFWFIYKCNRDGTKWYQENEYINIYRHNYMSYRTSKGSSWSWSCGSWINNYLCNQCLSPLTLW